MNTMKYALIGGICIYIMSELLSSAPSRPKTSSIIGLNKMLARVQNEPSVKIQVSTSNFTPGIIVYMTSQMGPP